MGENAMLTAHVSPWAIITPLQPSVSTTKSTPVKSVENNIVPGPGFVATTVCGAVLDPITVGPNVSRTGLSACSKPVPESDAVICDPAAVSVTMSDPETNPKVLGLKSTLIWQLLIGATLLPQVF
jgi:hypothetical protein